MIRASQHVTDIARLFHQLQTAMTADIVKGFEFTRPVAQDEDGTARNCDRGRISGLCQFVGECGEHPGIPKYPFILEGEKTVARIGLRGQSMSDPIAML